MSLHVIYSIAMLKRCRGINDLGGVILLHLRLVLETFCSGTLFPVAIIQPILPFPNIFPLSELGHGRFIFLIFFLSWSLFGFRHCCPFIRASPTLFIQRLIGLRTRRLMRLHGINRIALESLRFAKHIISPIPF